MNSTETVSDNLEIITGIGPEARKWLEETFNVRTFADLAELPEEKLLDRIKAEKKPWMMWAKNWPSDAEKFVTSEQTSGVPSKSSQEKPNSSSQAKDGWETLGLYFIEFQTRHTEKSPAEIQTKVVFEGPGEQVQENLPGFEQDVICKWIFEHYNSLIEQRPKIKTDSDTNKMIENFNMLSISIIQLCFFQPPDTRSPLFKYSGKQSRIRTLLADKPFNIELQVEKAQLKTSLKYPVTLNAEFQVKNWETREVINLGQVEIETSNQQVVHQFRATNILLPRGKYRLQTLVFAHPKPIVLGSIEVPILIVW